MTSQSSHMVPQLQTKINPIRPGGGSEARMAKLTAANQEPLIL